MCFDSSSSSSSRQDQRDERVAATDSAIVGRDNAIINVTGDNAFEFASDALYMVGDIAREVIIGAGQLSQAAQATADRTLEFVDLQRQDEEQRSLRSSIPWLVGGASVIAITYAMRK